MEADTDETGRLADGPLAYLSATDRELCDAIAQLTARIAALEPQDAAIYELVAERRELSQTLTYSQRKRKTQR